MHRGVLQCDVSSTSMNDSADTTYTVQLYNAKGTITSTKTNGYQTTAAATFSLVSVAPTQLSAAGYTMIKICGNGNELTKNINLTSILIGGQKCLDGGVSLSSDASCVTCLSPPISFSTTNPVLSVHVEGKGKVNNNGITLTSSKSAIRADSLAGTLTKGSSGDTLTILGSGFSTTPSENIVDIVSMDRQCDQFNECIDLQELTKCTPSSSTTTQIKCTIAAIQTQPQLDWFNKYSLNQGSVRVTVKGLGRAVGQPAFKFAVYVDNIAPTQGSMLGGDILTVTGRGLLALNEMPSMVTGSKYKTEIFVNVGKEKTACVVVSFEDTQIQCTMPSTPSSCTNCSVTFSSAVTSTVSIQAKERASRMEHCS